MKFEKMHGAGNDFLVVESSGDERDWSAISIAMFDLAVASGHSTRAEHADVDLGQRSKRR